MIKKIHVAAVFTAASLLVAACGSDDDNASTTAAVSGDTTASADTAAPSDDTTAPAETAAPSDDTVSLTTGGDITIHMVTHSDDGPFWSVVKRGAEQAAKDLGITVVWDASNNDPAKQVQLIEPPSPRAQAASPRRCPAPIS